MKIVIGVGPEGSNADALALGALLAQLLGAGVTLARINPPTIDYPSRGNVDAEWTAYLQEQSTTSLNNARDLLNTRWAMSDVDTIAHANMSVSRGLSEVAEQVGASFIVLGPHAEGHNGQISLGSTTHSLAHGALVGIAVAPMGFSEVAPNQIGRLVVGFREGSLGEQVLRWSVDVARREGMSVELLTVITRVTRMPGGRIGHDPERMVLQALHEQEQRAQREATKGLSQNIECTVAEGDTVAEALRGFGWRKDDVFVIGSSRFGVISRVFMGDFSLKLLRAASVPVILLPRQE